MCLTEEQIRRTDMDFSSKKCDQRIISQSPRRIELEFHCEGIDGAGTGRGEIVIHSDEHYTGQFEFDTEMNGEATQLTMNQEGR